MLAVLSDKLLCFNYNDFAAMTFKIIKCTKGSDILCVCVGSDIYPNYLFTICMEINLFMLTNIITETNYLWRVGLYWKSIVFLKEI